MSPSEYLGIVGVFFALAAYAVYISSVMVGRTRPHVLSWIIWCVANGVVFAAQWQASAGAGMWPTLAGCLCAASVVVLACVQGEKRITRADWVVFAAALCAVAVWPLTGSALWSVVLLSAIDTSAFIPTTRKVWHKPYEENILFFILNLTRWIFAFAALESWQLVAVIYPLVNLLSHSLFVSIVLWRRYVLMQKTAGGKPAVYREEKARRPVL